MPFGEELFCKLVDRGQYSEAQAHNIIKQLLAAVEYLHANGIVHQALRVSFVFI
jgi:serine/threonine protein kinase